MWSTCLICHKEGLRVGFELIVSVQEYNLSSFLIIMSELDPCSLFGGYFNLHPNDAYEHVQEFSLFLGAFTEAFKQRIQAEIQYSRLLLKVGSMLQRFITPKDPSPVSFIASAFQVENEERARHALELAQYLHSEVEVPCTNQLRQSEQELRRLERQLKSFYKQGETVEQTYQKQLKRYYRTHQQWQQRMITKNILCCTPGTTTSQKEKAASRLEEDRRQNQQFRQKYIQGLEAFNSFATRYNSSIGAVITELQRIEVSNLTLQTDSIRKLIISEINMFKNIEYDMLNISRQMESVSPAQQIQDFVKDRKDNFNAPIISIYSQGPIENRYDAIDLKVSICSTYLEESLLRIDKGVLYWLLENKTNSTLRYAVENLILRQEGKEGAKEDVEGEYLREMQASIKSNKSIKAIPINGNTKQREYLTFGQVYYSCLELVNAIGQLLKQKTLCKDELLQLVEEHISKHHFYRFIAYAALNAHQEQHQQRVTGQNYPQVLKILLQKSLATKDIFICRLIISLLFSVAYLTQRPFYCFQYQPIRTLECWQNKDFWQACIFQATFQACIQLPSVERSYLKEVYLMRQKNVVFSTMATYCHHMVVMGQDLQDVKASIARFADIYNLTEEHQKDLGKSIAASMRQLKDIEEEGQG